MKARIKITINGKETIACQGDTVLASLVAAGHKILKKSRKLHENRGPLCAMGICYECQVTINGEPNQRACMAEVKDEMMILIDES
jgi:predicted molibdopterin-dependent oxidoreductase YjgC